LLQSLLEIWSLFSFSINEPESSDSNDNEAEKPYSHLSGFRGVHLHPRQAFRALD
jgi:hypothetical protein